MPGYTNTFDRQLADNLDQASSGLRYNDPTDSVFTAGKSAMGLLPEMRQLDEVMRSRAAMNENSRDIRKDIYDDGVAQTDAGVFDSFSKDLDGLAGIEDPQERAQYISKTLQKDPRRLANKDVMASAKALSDADLAITQAGASALTRRNTSLAMRGMQTQEDNFERDQETAVIESRTNLEKAKMGEQAHAALKLDSKMSAADRFGTGLGKARNLPPEIAEGLIGLTAAFGEGPEADAYVNALGEMAAAHEKSSYVTQSVAASGKAYAPYLKMAADNGIDLDAVTNDDTLRPEAERQMTAAYRKRLIANGKSEKEADELISRDGDRMSDALNHHAKLTHAKRESDSYTQMLAGLPAELQQLAANKDTDPKAKAELNRKMAVASFRAFKARELVDGSLRREDESMKKKEGELKLQKSYEEMKSTIAARKNASGRLDLAVHAQEWRESGRQIKDLVALLGQAKNAKMIDKIKDGDIYKQLVMEAEAELAGTSSKSDNIYENQ